MDLTNARTEAAASYKERQAVIDTQVRLASVAYTLLRKTVEGEHGDRVLGKLYGELAHKTRAVHRVPSPITKVDAAAQRGLALSVAAIHADFEWASRDLLSDALEFWESRWRPVLGKAKPPGPAPGPLAKRGWNGTVSDALRTHSADDGFLLGCYSLLRIEPQKTDLAALPLFDFFRRCRNRILHQDGTAGSDLVDFAKSKKVDAAFKSLGPAVCKMAPELPELSATEPIILTPAHAILFLIVARALFNSLASRIRSEMDASGYFRMVAHYAYGTPYHPFRRSYYKYVFTPASTFLEERYHVRDLDKHDLVRRLRVFGLWDAISARFAELFPKARA